MTKRRDCPKDPPPLQVLVFGHRLSAQTREYLTDTYGPGVVVYNGFFHAQTLDIVDDAVSKALHRIQREGADFTGETPTLVALPGLTVGAVLAVTALSRAFGRGVRILNLIRQTKNGHEFYAPSPELPEIDLEVFGNAYGRPQRSLGSAVEVLGQTA